jgi:hypothetical protein
MKIYTQKLNVLRAFKTKKNSWDFYFKFYKLHLLSSCITNNNILHLSTLMKFIFILYKHLKDQTLRYRYNFSLFELDYLFFLPQKCFM